MKMNISTGTLVASPSSLLSYGQFNGGDQEHHHRRRRQKRRRFGVGEGAAALGQGKTPTPGWMKVVAEGAAAFRACSVLPNRYGLRGIEGVSIPSKSKFPPIHINPLQSIWIENNQTSPYWDRVFIASPQCLNSHTTHVECTRRLWLGRNGENFDIIKHGVCGFDEIEAKERDSTI
jgi:hypothetical protein